MCRVKFKDGYKLKTTRKEVVADNTGTFRQLSETATQVSLPPYLDVWLAWRDCYHQHLDSVSFENVASRQNLPGRVSQHDDRGSHLAQSRPPGVRPVRQQQFYQHEEQHGGVQAVIHPGWHVVLQHARVLYESGVQQRVQHPEVQRHELGGGDRGLLEN